VAAAKREGRISIIGGPGSDNQEGLVQGFQRKYPEIQVEYNAILGPQLVPKLATEQSANQYLHDIINTGTTTVIENLMPAGTVTSFQPYLVGPAAREQSQWPEGRLQFADEAGQYNLVFSVYVKAPFVYSKQLAGPSDFRSFRDLLNPKWKGKIVLRDPRLAGGGQANVTFWYTTEGLGRDFIAQLFEQTPTISGDNRQILNWVAQGQYAIGIGVGDLETLELQRNGVPIEMVNGGSLREGTYVTAGNGSLAIPKDPPHPNALMVYLDYLLSQEGQLAWSRIVGLPSLRRDVAVDHIPPILVPQAGASYQKNYVEEYVKLRPTVDEVVRPLLPR
jgi:ABC-type Fe3+ transport system substrate-binding protein